MVMGYAAHMPQGVFSAMKPELAAGGILTAANVNYHDGGALRWAGGPIAWDSVLCPSDLILADFCANAGEGSIASSDGKPGDSWPFGIVSSYKCLTVGMSLEERRVIAKQQAELGTPKALERELQTAGIAHAANRLDVPYLADQHAVDVGIADSGVVFGIAALEQALADCGLGTQGVIHMTRSAAILASSHNLLVPSSDGGLSTVLGTPVIAGVGYDPSVTKATGAATVVDLSTGTPLRKGPVTLPTSQAMYATGPVAVHLGPVDIIAEITNHTTNEMAVVAGRSAAVYFDGCCHFVVNVDLGRI
jgi:hypothetical protein